VSSGEKHDESAHRTRAGSEVPFTAGNVVLSENVENPTHDAWSV